MIILLTDSTYDIIISFFDFEEGVNMNGVGITMSQESYIDGKETKMYQMESEDIPEEFREDLLAFHDEFIYTKEEGFRRRPMISIGIPDDSQLIKVSQDGASVFPIGEDIKLNVKYIDPDNVGFIHKFDKIKVKDRNDFISVTPFIDVDTKKHEYELIVKSDFPGVAMIRAKDVNYLCGFDTFLMRFKQQ